MILDQDYGASQKRALVVPFLAVDTPSTDASFSDIDVTGILTCICKVRQGLSQQDFVRFKTYVLLLSKRLPEIICLMILKAININVLVIEEFFIDTRIYQEIRNLPSVIDYYLLNCLLPDELTFRTKQQNIAFVDVCSSIHSSKRIGFTGTTQSMQLPIKIKSFEILFLVCF